MKLLITCAAVAVVSVAATVAITSERAVGGQAQPVATAAAYRDPFKPMNRSLQAIKRSNNAILAELRALNGAVGTSGGLNTVLSEMRDIHKVVGNSSGIFNILDEVQAIARNTR